jgi:dephospho-CoA kinase
MPTSSNSHAYGFMGLPGAGKSYAADIAADYFETSAVNIGDVVRSIARSEDELGSEANGEDIGNWVTEQLAADKQAVIRRVLEDIETMSLGENVVIDGVRTLADYRGLNDAFDQFTLILVDADEETRLARLTTRGRDGEETFSLDDLRTRDERERSWGVADLLDNELYDHAIDNSEADTLTPRLVALLESISTSHRPTA